MLAADDLVFKNAIGALQAGRLGDAERQFKAILAQQPNNVAALSILGALLASQSKYLDAEPILRFAVELDPNLDSTLYNYGLVLKGLGRSDAAIEQFNKATELKPAFVEAWLAKGSALHELGRYEEARDAYNTTLSLQPNVAQTWLCFGHVCVETSRYEEALQAYARALKLSPNMEGAWLGRGNAYLGLKSLDKALAAYETALKLAPGSAEAWYGRGNVLFALKRHSEASAAYDKTLELKSDLAEAWYARANAYGELKRYEEAVLAYGQAVKLKPDLRDAEGCRLHTRQIVCDWANLESDWDHLLAAMRTGTTTVPPLAVLAGPASTADHIASAKRYTAQQLGLGARKRLWRDERYAHDRIRIAYVSPDFRNHPVARLLVNMFEHHDRDRFETIAIALSADDHSPIRARVKAAVDRFIDVSDLSDVDAAHLIRDNEVDIVVDLGGFTSGSRPAIVALRPAPVQVTYLSYPGIIGGGIIDYILADRIVIPRDDCSLMSERVVYLPDAYLGYDSKQAISERIPSRVEQGLPESGFVFCGYNNTFKIMPQVFDIWMRLLKSVPGSVLWLMNTNPAAVSNLRREARARGVDADRLCFAPYADDVADHLARYRLADLFLDTLPFNAQTTACDALWAGLPVLTRFGTTFVGRAAASLLNAVKLPELITYSAEEYEALALELATDIPRLASIRRKLADHRLTTPLFNSALFTRHVEAAYGAMVERHQTGLPPDHMMVPRLAT